MKNNNMKLPIIIIVIGMILAVASCFLTGILKEPIIKQHDFEYSVTYKLDGEEKTLDGIFSCNFGGHDEYDNLTTRYYDGKYIRNGEEAYSSWTMIAQKDGIELHIITELDAAYLMGDPDKLEYESGNEDPYLTAFDADGCAVEVSDVFDAEILGWVYPDPVVNSFEFVGFSILHAGSMVAMLLVGVLTIIACIIFVRKSSDVSYKSLDTLSVVMNLVIGFGAIPFGTFMIWLFPLAMDATSLMYQIYLCVPAMTAFTIAASVALRRKGFTKSGLIVQFVFPVLFFAEIFVESLIYNLS